MSQSTAAHPLAVVLASIDARASVCASIGRFRNEIDGRGELIVVDASRDGTAELVRERFPDVRVLRSPPGRLAPELWREGLAATGAPLVAFSTAQMVPAPGWRAALLDRLEATGAAVVGGPIDPAPGLVPRDRAVFLQRYVNYLRPLIAPGHAEPPGDNAVYRRDRLAGLESLWVHGFWEVEIHQALRARGELLAMAERAAVAFHGGTRLAPLLNQRYSHARHYGASRARLIGRGARLAHLVAAPAVPAVMMRRIVAALARRRQPLASWLPAFPDLLTLLTAWSLGEARGFAEVFCGECTLASPLTKGGPKDPIHQEVLAWTPTD